MKRLHVHVGVADLNQSIQFYSMLFGAQPSKQKADYAKWMLEDPKVNFAVSTGEKTGLSHLGIQAEDQAELDTACCG
jgi:catechol 2,3-dioxygenase-like lactoylglutathione lyase family enzyme